MAPPQGENTTPLVKKQNAAREVVDVLHEISTLLNTSLDRNQLSMCISMVENGVNPEALATVIKELRKEQVEGTEELERSKKQRR